MSQLAPPRAPANPAASVSNDTSLRVLSIACGLTEDAAPLTSPRALRPTATEAGLRLLSHSLRAVDRKATAFRNARAAARSAAA